jgi:hypothetical protein
MYWSTAIILRQPAYGVWARLEPVPFAINRGDKR